VLAQLTGWFGAVTSDWELVRTDSGWKIKRRTLRPLDGSEPARELLRGALKSYEPAG